MLKNGWKLTAVALLSIWPALAFAGPDDISQIDVTPTPRSVSGFSNLVVPINGDGVEADGGAARFSISFVESVDVQVRVKGKSGGDETILPFPSGATVEEDVDSVDFVVGKDLGATQDEGNVVNIFSRVASSTAAFNTTSATYTVFVDRIKPLAPPSISADGADQTVVVNWSPPGKTGTEFFDNYIITYDDEDFSEKSTAEVGALPTETVGAGDTEAVLDGLENGVVYYVTVRTVDWVGNVSDFPRDAAGNITTATAEPVITVSLAELAGEEGGCFIATAAYGSYHEEHVQILRRFRDRVLLESDLGRAFVAWYYRTSPPLAAWIATSDWARTIVRVALWPLYGLAYVALHPAVLLLLIPAGVYLVRRRRMFAEVTS